MLHRQYEATSPTPHQYYPSATSLQPLPIQAPTPGDTRPSSQQGSATAQQTKTRGSGQDEDENLQGNDEYGTKNDSPSNHTSTILRSGVSHASEPANGSQAEGGEVGDRNEGSTLRLNGGVMAEDVWKVNPDESVALRGSSPQPITQNKKQPVTTSETKATSVHHRGSEAPVQCPVPSCGERFTRRRKFRGKPCHTLKLVAQ